MNSRRYDDHTMIRRLKFRRTTLIIFGLSSFLCGLVLARRVEVYGSYLLIPIGVATLLAYRKRNVLSIVTVFLFCALLGCWRGTVYMNRLEIYKDLALQPVTMQATATSDSVYADRGQINFDVGKIYLTEPVKQKIDGKIAVKGYGEPMIYRGDRVEITAKLYPTRGSKQASMSFSKIVKLESSYSFVDFIRRDFAAGLLSSVPEPLGSFGLGILIGQRTTLPKELNEQLSVVGLTHIVAVSGYNLTIIVQAVHRMLRKRSKYQSTLMTLSLIGLFLLITGSSASIVRAAIVSTLSLWAWYYGRNFRPLLLILLAAVITAGWFPPYIWSDVGWYLSFFAFAGVMILGPMIIKRFWKGREPKLIPQILIETTAAQALTLPIIMYIFGRLSLIALLSNIMVVPLIPLVMAFSFIAGLSGMIIPTLAGWLAWPATLTMTYMIDIVRLLAGLPNASINQKLAFYQLVFAYLIIGLVLLAWWQKTPKNVRIKKLNYKTTLQSSNLD